jgi:hypothetical protein
MKLLFRLLIVAAVAAGLFLVFRNNPDFQKLEKTTHSEIEKSQHSASAAAKEGIQKANVLATNATHEADKSAQQAGKAITNAVEKVRRRAADAVVQVKDAAGSTNH